MTVSFDTIAELLSLLAFGAGGVGVQVADFFQAIWDFLRNTVVEMWEGALGIWQWFGDMFDTIVGFFGDLFQAVVQWIVRQWSFIVSAFADVYNWAVETIFLPLQTTFNWVLDALGEGWTGLGTLVWRLLQVLWEGLSYLFGIIFDPIAAIFDEVLSWLLVNWEKVLPGLVLLFALGAGALGVAIRALSLFFIWLLKRLGIISLAVGAAKLLRWLLPEWLITGFAAVWAGLLAWSKLGSALVAARVLLSLAVFAVVVTWLIGEILFNEEVLGVSVVGGFSDLVAGVLISIGGMLIGDTPDNVDMIAVVAAQLKQFIRFLFYLLAVDLIVGLFLSAWAANFILRRFRWVMNVV